MNKYETVFLMKDDITEDQRKEVINEVEKYLTENAKITKKEDLGKRKLAYRVRNYDYAYYYTFYFTGKPDVIISLEKLYRLNENIIKFIVVKITD